MAKRNIELSELSNLYVLYDTTEDNMFYKSTKNKDYYEASFGIEGAELFTLEEAKEVKGDDSEIGIILFRDATANQYLIEE